MDEKLEKILKESIYDHHNQVLIVSLKNMNWMTKKISQMATLNKFAPAQLKQLLKASPNDPSLNNTSNQKIISLSSFDKSKICDHNTNFENANTILKSEHGEIKIEFTVNNNIWLSINDIKLVLIQYDDIREAFVVRAYNKDLPHDDYEYIQEIPSMTKQFDKKLNELVKRKESELGIYTVYVELDRDRHAHILAKRKRDGKFIVWTSNYTNELETSYLDYCNGVYDLDLNTAVKELNDRTKLTASVS